MRIRREKQNTSPTLTEKLRESAERLSGRVALSEETIAEREKANTEHDKHEALIEKAKGLKSLEWHIDEESPIPDLPEDTTVAYQLKQLSDARTAVSVRLGTEKGDVGESYELVHLVDGEMETYKDEGALYSRPREIEFAWDYGFTTGVVVPPKETLISPEETRLSVAFSGSEAFTYAERALDVIQAGELAASGREAQPV